MQNPGNRPPPARAGVWLRGAALNLAAAAVGLLLSELVLAAAAALSPAVAYRLQPPEVRLSLDGNPMVVPREVVPDPVLGHRRSPHSGRFDAWGYRNPAVPDGAVVLALGDSMTIGHDVASEEAWPRVLARLGGFSTYNAGIGGYGPAEYQAVLEETLRLRPRLVVVGLFPGNDIQDAFRSAYVRAGEPFKHLRSADPGVLAQLDELERAESLRARTLRLAGKGVSGEPNGPQEPGGPRAWLSKHSRIYALGREAKTVSRAAWSRMRGEAQPVPAGEKHLDTFEASAAKPHRVPWDGDARVRTVFVKPELMQLALNLDDPRIREGQRIAAAVLAGMQQRLASQGIDLLVMIIPTKESAYAPLLARAPGGLSPPAREFLAVEQRLRGEIIASLSASGIAYVDVLPALQAPLLKAIPVFNESDDGHPNAAGQAAIARALLPVVQLRLARSSADETGNR